MIKLLGKRVQDEDTEIEAVIDNKHISVQPRGNNGFVFKDSKVQTVEKVAHALLRFAEYAKQEALNSEYKTNE